MKKLPTTHYLLPTRNAGFTLVEVLITILLFGTALAASTYILSTNLRSATAIQNNFIASGLAQEGMEVVRNIRDRDWFLGNPFGASLTDGTYRVQWDSSVLTALGADSNLKKDNGNGLFNYDTGVDTIFRRTVEISTVTANVEKKVVVTVSWTERGGFAKSLSTEEHLYNWR